MQKNLVKSLQAQIGHIEPEQRRTLMTSWLVPHPHKDYDPAEVVIQDVGTSVWAIIGALPAAGADVEQVARDFEIDVEAVIAAVAYYLDNQGLIDWRLRQNQSEPIRII